jgi:apolipoprotein N-acyltransferase
MRAEGLRRHRTAPLAALVLGLAHASSFAPLSHWTLALASLAGLFWLIGRDADAGARPLRQAALAFAFSMGWFVAGLAWLYVSMHTYGGMPAPMAAAAVVLFAGYLSLYPAAATWAVARGCGRAGPLALAAGFAGAWTFAEIARGWVMTGFPWLATGYAQIDGPLDRLAPLSGVFGVGGVAVAVAVLVAAALRPGDARRAIPAAVALALLAAPLAVPREGWTEPYGPPLDVRLVQGNVPQDMKFDPARTLAAMRDYATRFEAGAATLTILPETAWTVPWDRTPEPIARGILDHVARGHALALGLPSFVPSPGGEPRLANSVLLLAADAPARRYDKHHLVPFGEFVPWGFRWFVDMMHIPLGDFARGDRVQEPFEVGGQRIAFNVCYEDIFGEEIRAALPGERGATVLANVSNIGWFGRSHALPQHLAIARMRTLETGRPMLRATNTGMTAAIDGAGRVIAQLDPFTVGSLDVRVQGTTGLTPFARWGNVPAAATAALALAAALLAGRGRRNR